MDLEKLKYPIGRYQVEENIDRAAVNRFINEIELLPQRLADAAKGLKPEQLRTSYRQEGWTIQQVVHHIADKIAEIHYKSPAEIAAITTANAARLFAWGD